MKWLVATALVLGAASASAAPKGADAKAAFDKGVAAYTKGDYAGASDQLGRSYELEADVETLFAWAQTERKLEHCDKASGLYSKLLAADLPAANKAVVREKLDECQKILAAQAPKPEPVVTPPPVVEPRPEPTPIPPPPPPDEGHAWWANPVGGALVGVGLVGVGVGTVFLVQGRAANKDKSTALDYGEFQRLEDRAESRGKLGTGVLIGGGVLVTAGIVWYATHGSSKRGPQVSAWGTPDGGGVLAFGRF
ncbi:MAG: hypothetical protein ABI175_05020 [Polyangiales bacterium]